MPSKFMSTERHTSRPPDRTITMSGRMSATVGTALSPLVTTSSILIWVWALSSDRMCDATCGTSSITSNRICSPATPYLSQRPGVCLVVRWLLRS